MPVRRVEQWGSKERKMHSGGSNIENLLLRGVSVIDHCFFFKKRSRKKKLGTTKLGVPAVPSTGRPVRWELYSAGTVVKFRFANQPIIAPRVSVNR